MCTNNTDASHTINFSNSKINKVIGYDEDASDITVSAGGTTTSPFVCNLATVHSLMIKCSVGQGNVISTRAGNSETLQKVSVDVNSNGIIYLNQQDFRQISISQSPIVDTMEFRFTDQNDNLLQLNNCNFEFSMYFEVFPRYKARRRSIIEDNGRQQIPTQPTNVLRPDYIDDTHPIENLSAIQHKSNRLVLDQIIKQIDSA